MEQGHALIGFLLHSIDIADKENPFAFTVALDGVQACSPYIFSNAASAKVQTNPEAGGSR